MPRNAAISLNLFRVANLPILNQYLWFVHIVPSPSPTYTEGYAVWRHDDAVLRWRVSAEDDGADVIVHNSTAIKNTSLQSVLAISEMA